MTKLHELAQRLSDESVLSQKETEAIKGGKRYRTSSYSTYTYVKNMLQANGFQTQTDVHGNEYCIEW